MFSLSPTLRMGTVYGVRDRIIVKRPGVKSARQFKHVNRLLTELRGRYHGLLLRSFIGEAGLPGIKGALGVTRPCAPEVVDHRVLVPQDHILIAGPEFPVSGIPASRTDDHQVGLE